MRDIVIFSVIVFLAARALMHPSIGILAWTWVSLMTPHKFGYGFAMTAPVAMIVGGSTLIGIVVTKDRREGILCRETWVLILFMAWMCLALPFSMYLDESMVMWNRVMKIDFMILIAMVVLTSRKDIVALVWVLAGSIGFYGFKGGIFTILSGGSYRVWGPDETFISGNNELALALIVIIPLIRFLYLHGVQKPWAKRFLLLWMLLCAVSALGSQSRGAMLALGAMAFMMWLKSSSKALIGVGILVVGLALVAFMPDSWSQRMNTVKTYEQDNSAMERISAWKMAFNAASDRVFGTGYENVKESIYYRYGDSELMSHGAHTGNGGYMQGPHSIYFEVMGEQGFIGLIIFLTIWFLMWRRAAAIKKEVATIPEAQWCSDLAAMIQVSLIAYLVGGAFLGLAYWDLPYNLLVLVVIMNRWITHKEWEKVPAGPRRPPPAVRGRSSPGVR